MTERVKLQNPRKSKWTTNKLFSLDTEVIEDKTTPLIHQEARFLFVRKGEGTIRIHGKNYKLEKGVLVAILPWEISEVIEVKSPLQYYLLIYNFDMVIRLLKSYYNAENLPVDIIKSFSVSASAKGDKKQTEKILGVFEDLREEIGLESVCLKEENPNFGSICVINHIVYLMILFSRIHEPSLPEDTPNDILLFIFSHLSEKITLKSLSQHFFVEEKVISRFIKDLTGLTLSKLCHEMKIYRAASFLLYTDFTVEELSQMLNYFDSAHISKVFNARIGMNLSEYRKTYQNVSKICKIKESKMAYTAVNYIYRNYAEDLNVSSVSKELGVSEKYLNRILLYQVEKNFSDFLNEVRINEACRLLLNTDNTILDIAISVGYNNDRTFTRNFLSRKVMLPSEFRKKVTIQKIKNDK